MAAVQSGRRSPHNPRRGKRHSKHVSLSRRKSPESSRRGKRSVPLTPSNVMREVREVEDWWGERGLGYCISIPESKREEIRQKFPDEMEQKKQLISHWINTDPRASWRRLVCALDAMKETKIADSIRSYAEPLTDDSLTPHTLLPAVSTVTEFWDSDDEYGLLERLSVPYSVMDDIRASPLYSTEEEKRIAGLQYYLHTVPSASWENIAGVLWGLEEHTALEEVRQYLPPAHDPSLTPSNMSTALDTLPADKWDQFGTGLNVPHSKRDQIRSQFTSDEERKDEVIRIYHTQHPHPSWEHVSNALYMCGDAFEDQQFHNVLDRLQSMFPTGRNKAKKIYEEEMKRGITERLITKVTMVGTAGSGKSTSLETLTDEEPLGEEERESTPLLKRPVQTEVVFVEGKNVRWKKKTPEEKKRYIARILRARAQQLGQPVSRQPTVVREKHNSSKSTTASSQKPSPAAGKEASATSSITDNPPSTATPSTTTVAATGSGDQSSDTAPEVTVESLLESSELEEEFISLINIPSPSTDTVFTETCVYIVDSGGQPEFVDAMTVFLGQTSACILVIDLSQPLDYYPMIGYYRRGRAVSKPYKSTRTNEENLKLSMRTMHTFVSKTKGDPLNLLFLGTHRDKLHKCPSETVGDKNRRLEKLIPKKFANQVIWSSTEKLIFEINALKPDKLDKKTAEKVRRYVMEQCTPIKVKLPLRWQAFEEKLRSIAERLGRMVLSRQECLQVAESLGLEEDSFDLALEHFHTVSLMFYFRSILPKTVFVDPQVLLDKVSELVEFMFELRETEEEDKLSDNDAKPEEKDAADIGEKTTETPETPSDASNESEKSPRRVSDVARESYEVLSAAGEESSETSSDTAASTPEDPTLEKELSSGEGADIDLLPPGWQEFKWFGRITRKFLEDSRFSSHYVEGIFSCEDLIHLLEELLVFARQRSEDGSETWFMPSVLRHIPVGEMDKRCVSGGGALVVDFPDGGPQSGVFCSLMSHVLSPENHSPYSWKLHLSSQEPSCLYRDCIQFEVPNFPGSITFIDHYEYFEVHVYTSPAKEKELWGHVRKAVFGGIETVDETLGYSNNKPRPAIVCPRTHGHTDSPHPAYIKDREWICTSDTNVFGKLEAKYHWDNIPYEPPQAQSAAPLPARLSTASQPLDEPLQGQATHTTTPSSTRHTADQQNPLELSSQRLSAATPPTAPPTRNPAHAPQPLGIDDLFLVSSELLPVAHRWKNIGLALKLDPNLLERIQSRNHRDVLNYLSDILTEWLQKAYNTTRFGDPSWKLLVEAVAHRAGGNNPALAQDIALKYNVSSPPTYPSRNRHAKCTLY